MFAIVSVLLYGAVEVVVFAFVVLAGVGFSDLGLVDWRCVVSVAFVEL